MIAEESCRPTQASMSVMAVLRQLPADDDKRSPDDAANRSPNECI